MRCRRRLTSTPTIVCLTLIALTLTTACQSYTTELTKSEGRADETAIVATLRTVSVAQQSYATSNDGNYGSFRQLTEGGFLDSRFNSEAPQSRGYVLTMKVGEKAFSCNADPSGELKGRHFYVDASSPLIRVNASQPATAKDEVVNF